MHIQISSGCDSFSAVSLRLQVQLRRYHLGFEIFRRQNIFAVLLCSNIISRSEIGGFPNPTGE
jgi:hypothetical protein